MKKFLCLLLILCILPVCAFAGYLDVFNIYAKVMEVPQLDESMKVSGKNNMDIYRSDMCTIAFSLKSSGYPECIIVEGNDINFFAYSLASLMYFDDMKYFSAYAASLLSDAMMCRSGGEKTRRFADNLAYSISKSETTEGNLLIVVGE